MSSCLVPNEVPAIVKAAIAREINLPVGHYLHPDDPTKRTALCGAEILGVPTFGEFKVCSTCQSLREAHDAEPLDR